MVVPCETEYFIFTHRNGTNLPPPVRTPAGQPPRMRQELAGKIAHCYLAVEMSRLLGAAPLSVPAQESLVEDKIPALLQLMVRCQAPGNILVRQDKNVPVSTSGRSLGSTTRIGTPGNMTCKN